MGGVGGRPSESGFRTHWPGYLADSLCLATPFPAWWLSLAACLLGSFVNWESPGKAQAPGRGHRGCSGLISYSPPAKDSPWGGGKGRRCRALPAAGCSVRPSGAPVLGPDPAGVCHGGKAPEVGSTGPLVDLSPAVLRGDPGNPLCSSVFSSATRESTPGRRGVRGSATPPGGPGTKGARPWRWSLCRRSLFLPPLLTLPAASPAPVLGGPCALGQHLWWAGSWSLRDPARCPRGKGRPWGPRGCPLPPPTHFLPLLPQRGTIGDSSRPGLETCPPRLVPAGHRKAQGGAGAGCTPETVPFAARQREGRAGGLCGLCGETRLDSTGRGDQPLVVQLGGTRQAQVAPGQSPQPRVWGAMPCRLAVQAALSGGYRGVEGRRRAGSRERRGRTARVSAGLLGPCSGNTCRELAWAKCCPPLGPLPSWDPRSLELSSQRPVLSPICSSSHPPGAAFPLHVLNVFIFSYENVLASTCSYSSVS
ncbi:collagen alpha-1(I) chain-like [Choloepus didactylus]|uniref:collagen alpha-1(I) chain-like n=1 Tax=Choloepus didactylus TaxID=27675 RepID=UPI00189E7ADC|nr:collagen alpha-1(I) chain-like [Choloepus didactylus]